MLNFDYANISNPVLSLDKAHVRDPAILVHDDLIYLFFTYYDPEKKTWHVGMNKTEDFVHFSDVSLISPEGYASPGNVIRTNDKWVICYQQYREFPHYLCLSYSEDLTRWSKPVKIFNTGPENKWNIDKRVIDPYLVEWQGSYYCYYTGSTRLGKKSGYNFIGVALSMDLENWEDISIDKPVIGVDYPWKEPDGCENNCVIRHQDRWHMLYSASDRFYMIYQGRASDGHMSFLLLESNDLVDWH